MANTQPSSSQPLLSSPALPPYGEPPAYIVIPSFPVLLHRRRRPRHQCLCHCAKTLSFLVAVLVVAFAAIALWPEDVEVAVSRLAIDRVRPHLRPRPSLDLSLRLRLRVRNPNFFSFEYKSVVSSVSYRGSPLGHADGSNGGSVLAQRDSYIDVRLDLDGVKVIGDAIYMIEDLRRKSITFDTVTEVDGILGLFSLQIPVKGRYSCSVNVNPETQKIIGQDCYPE